MIVEEIRIRGATIRVHDDSYVNRTKEEIQSSIDACSRIIREAKKARRYICNQLKKAHHSN